MFNKKIFSKKKKIKTDYHNITTKDFKKQNIYI